MYSFIFTIGNICFHHEIRSPFFISTLLLKPNEKFTLCGVDYRIDFSEHVVAQRMDRVYKKIGTCENLMTRILFLLTQIEDYVVNEIRIGETFAIFDEVLKISFAVGVSIDTITIITVFDEAERDKGRSLKLFKGEKVLMIDSEMVSFYTFDKEKKRNIPDTTI